MIKQGDTSDAKQQASGGLRGCRMPARPAACQAPHVLSLRGGLPPHVRPDAPCVDRRRPAAAPGTRPARRARRGAGAPRRPCGRWPPRRPRPGSRSRWASGPAARCRGNWEGRKHALKFTTTGHSSACAATDTPRGCKRTPAMSRSGPAVSSSPTARAPATTRSWTPRAAGCAAPPPAAAGSAATARSGRARTPWMRAARRAPTRPAARAAVRAVTLHAH